MLSPFKHWCFIADIKVAARTTRWRALVETRFGENAVIHFHPDGEEGLSTIAWESPKDVNITAILCAQKKTMGDLSLGIWQEHLDTVYVFHCTQAELIQNSKRLMRLDSGENQCFSEACSVENRSSDIRVCSVCTHAACRITAYCCADHQRTDWRKSHTKLCKQMATLKKLAALDFNKWRGFYNFNLYVEEQSVASDNVKRNNAMADFMISHGVLAPPIEATSSLPRSLHTSGCSTEKWSLNVKEFIERNGRMKLMFENENDIVEGYLLPLLEEAENCSASGKRHVIINARGGISFDLLSIALLHLHVWSVNARGRASALNWCIQLSSVMPWHKELYSRLDGWTIANDD